MKRSISEIFIRGLTLAIPLAVVVYVFARIILFFRVFLTPVAEYMGIERILGRLTLTILAVLTVVLLILLLGLLLRWELTRRLRQRMEFRLLQFFPSLNYLKVMTTSHPNPKHPENSWKPVVMLYEGSYSLAFIIEENERFITLLTSNRPLFREPEILTVARHDVRTIPISHQELYQCNRQFGKGILALAERHANETDAPISN